LKGLGTVIVTRAGAQGSIPFAFTVSTFVMSNYVAAIVRPLAGMLRTVALLLHWAGFGVMREGSGSEWAGDSLVLRDKQEEAHSQEN